jgi:hypothetical protein
MKEYVRPLGDAEDAALRSLIRSRTVPAGIHDRARMIFWASQGQSPHQIASRLDYKEDNVRKWLRRFNDQGLAGLVERPGRGRKPQFSAADSLTVVETMLAAPG